MICSWKSSGRTLLTPGPLRIILRRIQSGMIGVVCQSGSDLVDIFTRHGIFRFKRRSRTMRFRGSRQSIGSKLLSMPGDEGEKLLPIRAWTFGAYRQVNPKTIFNGTVLDIKSQLLRLDSGLWRGTEAWTASKISLTAFTAGSWQQVLSINFAGSQAASHRFQVRTD